MKGTWQTSDSGGTGGTLALIVVLAVVVAAIAGPVVAAVTAAIEVVLAVIVALAALAIAAAASYLAWRHRHPRAPPSWAADPRASARLATARGAGLQPRQARRELPPAHVHNHVHLHGLSDDQLAALIGRKDRP